MLRVIEVHDSRDTSQQTTQHKRRQPVECHRNSARDRGRRTDTDREQGSTRSRMEQVPDDQEGSRGDQYRHKVQRSLLKKPRRLGSGYAGCNLIVAGGPPGHQFLRNKNTRNGHDGQMHSRDAQGGKAH